MHFQSILIPHYMIDIIWKMYPLLLKDMTFFCAWEMWLTYVHLIFWHGKFFKLKKYSAVLSQMLFVMFLSFSWNISYICNIFLLLLKVHWASASNITSNVPSALSSMLCVWGFCVHRIMQCVAITELKMQCHIKAA